jgi:hypothetical protein
MAYNAQASRRAELSGTLSGACAERHFLLFRLPSRSREAEPRSGDA